jgi:ABC-type uncharacterized transport system auxiliary subunit
MKPPCSKRIFRIGLLILVALVSLSACATLKTPPRPIYFYTISYPPPKPSTAPPISAVLRISRFSAVPPFTSDDMVFSSSDTQRGTYTFHKWESRPADMIESLLYRDFLESKSLAGVFPSAQRIGSTHSLDGIIESFYQKNENGRNLAVVGIAVTLIAEKETDPIKRFVFQKRYLEEEPISKAEPQYFAEAMGRAVSRLSEAIRSDVLKALSNFPAS